MNYLPVYTCILTANRSENTLCLDHKCDIIKGLANLASWDETSCFQDLERIIN